MADRDLLPELLRDALQDRHEDTRHIGRFFVYDHLKGRLRNISKRFAFLFLELLGDLPDGPEFTAGARKLVEAKDCMVRQALIANPQDGR